jgi:hypothetical protein
MDRRSDAFNRIARGGAPIAKNLVGNSVQPFRGGRRLPTPPGGQTATPTSGSVEQPRYMQRQSAPTPSASDQSAQTSSNSPKSGCGCSRKRSS